MEDERKRRWKRRWKRRERGDGRGEKEVKDLPKTPRRKREKQNNTHIS